MALRQKRHRFLTDQEKVTLESIRHRHREEHDALSNPFYQKKQSVGVTSSEEAQFQVAHDAILAKLEQEMLDAGLREEYDEIGEVVVAVNEQLTRLNELRRDRGLGPLQIVEQ